MQHILRIVVPSTLDVSHLATWNIQELRQMQYDLLHGQCRHASTADINNNNNKNNKNHNKNNNNNAIKPLVFAGMDVNNASVQ
jgi:hypothetical protein